MALFGAPKKTPEAPPPAPPAPPPLDVKAIVTEAVTGAVQGVAAQLGQTVNALGEKVEALASRQPQVIVQNPGAQAPVVRQDLSDEVIDQAILAGPGAAQRIRALVDARVNEAADRMVREHINPLREFGVQTIGDITRRVTVGGMPHYARFKKEIDEKLNTLSPEVRANPSVQEMIYNSVVGLHTEELTREASEAAVRQAQAGGSGGGAPPAPTPGTGAGPGARREAPEVPTAEQVGGADALAALSHKGRDGRGQNQDEFAQSMGYANWAAYQKQYNDLLNGEGETR